MWSTIWPYLTAILPTVGVAIIFYYLMRAILQSDHRERLAQAQWEAEQDRAVRRQQTDIADAEQSSDAENSGNAPVS